MKVLIDTSVWSLALRKKEKSQSDMNIIDNLKKVIHEYRSVIIGPIRQEILSGIRDINKFVELKQKLSFFEDEELKTSDFENAAELFNKCRSAGIQGSPIDFIICSVAVNRKYLLFTLDNDFTHYAKLINLSFYQLR